MIFLGDDRDYPDDPIGAIGTMGTIWVIGAVCSGWVFFVIVTDTNKVCTGMRLLIYSGRSRGNLGGTRTQRVIRRAQLIRYLAW